MVVSPLNFPDLSILDAKNYCRNPDNSQIVWCYATDPDVKRENCRVPACNSQSMSVNYVQLYIFYKTNLKTTQIDFENSKIF